MREQKTRFKTTWKNAQSGGEKGGGHGGCPATRKGIASIAEKESSDNDVIKTTLLSL